MAPADTALVSKAPSESPYQLDKPQTLKASTALLKHIQSEAKCKEAASATKNLFAASSDSSDDTGGATNEPVWLCFTTKKHIIDKKRLKPGKITLPHSLHDSPHTSICLITADPQRAMKDTIAHPSFPSSLRPRIHRILGLSKLKARYNSYESRRQLLSEHDIFLADDRIVTELPKSLGKIFYKGTKRPVPFSAGSYKQRGTTAKRLQSPNDTKSKPVASPIQVAHEIEKTIKCAQINLSPSATVSIHVGSSSFTAAQLAENIEAVVNGMVAKYVSRGWRNIRSLHIKGPNTMALPVWLANELWVDEKDILEAEEAAEAKALASQKGRKRKGREGEDDGSSTKKKAKKLKETDLSNEMAERRRKVRQQKKEAREAIDNVLVPEGEEVQKQKEVQDSKTKVRNKEVEA